MQEEIYNPPRAVAEELNLSVGTLANWRNKRIGPPYIKAGACVLYPRSKLNAWLTDRTVIPNGVAA